MKFDKELVKKIVISLTFGILINCFVFQYIFNCGYYCPNNASKVYLYTLINIPILSIMFFLNLLVMESKNKILKIVSNIFFIVSTIFLIRALQLFAGISLSKLHLYIKYLIFLSLILVFFFSFYKKRNLIQFLLIIIFPFSVYSLKLHLNNSFVLLKNKNEVSKPVSSKTAGNRIIWLVFDELDYNLIYDLRPDGICLEELDKLKQNAFFATKAMQPAGNTPESIMSYLSGKQIKELGSIKNYNELIYYTLNGEEGSTKKDESIFSKANSRGYKSCAIGWQLPFTNFFSEYLFQAKILNPSESYFAKLKGNKNLFYFNRVIFSMCLSKLFDWCSSKAVLWRLNIMKDVYTKSISFLNDVIEQGQSDFIFYHVSIPHYPGIYNMKNSRFTKDESSYYDNVVLVDKTISKIRKEIEKSSRKDETILIITSDHWFRKDLWGSHPAFFPNNMNALCAKREKPYIPVIIEMPKQQPLMYEKSFNAIIIHDIIVKIMDQKIHSYDEVASYIKKQNSLNLSKEN